MIKRVRNVKFERMLEGTMICEMVSVLDVAATQGKIQACETGWQGEINACNAEIEKYTNLINEIKGKRQEASELKAIINSDITAINNANIQHPDTKIDICPECLEDMIGSYDSMMSQCQSSISKWQAKKTKAEQNKAKCATDAANKVYKEQLSCHY